MIARSVVVLPAPLRPSSGDDLALARRRRSMPCRMWTSPYQPCRSLTSSSSRSAMASPRPYPYRLRSPAGSFDTSRIGAFGEHLAARQHRDAVGEVGDDRQVVLDHQDGAVAGDAPDQRRRCGRCPRAPMPAIGSSSSSISGSSASVVAISERALAAVGQLDRRHAAHRPSSPTSSSSSMARSFKRVEAALRAPEMKGVVPAGAAARPGRSRARSGGETPPRSGTSAPGRAAPRRLASAR